MSKFCAECGAPLDPHDKFCGSCGKPVINLCPTCGQTWDPPKAASKGRASEVPAATVPTSSREVIEPKQQKKVSNSWVQPIYGSEYVEGKDCPNCGAKGMARKTCTTCESEN